MISVCLEKVSSKKSKKGSRPFFALNSTNSLQLVSVTNLISEKTMFESSYYHTYRGQELHQPPEQKQI